MNAQQYILIKIAEEANEVAQRALKAAQFGVDQTEPGQTENNADRLETELLDLGFWVDIAQRNNVIAEFTRDDVDGHRDRKLPMAVKMFLLSMTEGQLAASGDIAF